MRMSKKTKVILYVILTLLAVYFLFPFVYMFFSTFKTESEAVAFPPKFLPDIWNWQNYVDAWKHFIYDPSCDNDDSVGCYDDPTVYGVQRIWMVEYFKATDYSVLVRISILYLPDAPVLDGRAERF